MSEFDNPDVLGPPPDRLTPDALQAWHDIVAQARPGVLIRADSLHVELTAGLLAEVRADLGNIEADKLGLLHKFLGQMFMGPADRAKLGIPESNIHFI
jgi:hypothetical protein